ncbi:MAG: hypothetical protein CMQ05_10780 [Gammaproteobacteria bacterium]|nr:hypothetical protein [Gammaproteobacteria bacterium]RPG24264.1 MAG: hypothetical protein CBC10_011760 [Gammaproteobacteria bacterium TMED50]
MTKSCEAQTAKPTIDGPRPRWKTVESAPPDLIPLSQQTSYRAFGRSCSRVNTDQAQSDFAIEGEDTTIPLLEEIFQLGVAGRFDQIVTWSYRNDTVAAVDEFGVVTFVSAGTVDITASVPGFSTDVLDFSAASDRITLTIVRSEQDELSFEFEGIETVVG